MHSMGNFHENSTHRKKWRKRGDICSTFLWRVDRSTRRLAYRLLCPIAVRADGPLPCVNGRRSRCENRNKRRVEASRWRSNFDKTGNAACFGESITANATRRVQCARVCARGRPDVRILTVLNAFVKSPVVSCKTHMWRGELHRVLNKRYRPMATKRLCPRR